MHKIFNTITIQLCILFAISIGGTYITEYLTENNWFKEYKCERKDYPVNGRDNVVFHHHGMQEHIKGEIYYFSKSNRREYYYIFLGALFITSAVRCIIIVNKQIKDYENTKTESKGIS